MARKAKQPTGHAILVVDDQEEILHSVRTLLEHHGHRVIIATSAQSALNVLKTQDVHLLLVDYLLPQLNGEQVIREIRKFDPYVRIILQTGSGEKPPSRLISELDISGYCHKTDGPEQLMLWVDAALKAYRLMCKLRERENLQAELVANVSHEFRTPLNAITGYADLLLQGHFGPLTRETRRVLRQIAVAAADLDCLVFDLLQLRKLQAGFTQGVRCWIETSQLAAEMRRLAELLLEGKEVAFVLDAARAPERFEADGVSLRVILRNLLTNAAKFTHRGTVRLRIFKECDALRFAMSDTGCGIAWEDQQLIFELFRQLDGSATRRHGGIGLGLALSRKLARGLGGDISVQSSTGAGSTFVLTIPAIGDDRRDWAGAQRSYPPNAEPRGSLYPLSAIQWLTSVPPLHAAPQTSRAEPQARHAALLSSRISRSKTRA